MTNPFLNLVGLKGVSGEPEPAVLVNDLAGISTELVTGLSNTDYADAAALWGKIQRTGLDKLRNIVEAELSRSADFRYVSERTDRITGEPTNMVLLPAAVYRGMLVQAPIGANDELFISRLLVDSADVVDVATVIKVFSGSGKELFSLDVTVKPDTNAFALNFGVRSNFGGYGLAFVGIDCTSLNLRVLGDGQTWDCGHLAFMLDAVTANVAFVNPFNLTNTDSATVMLEADVRRSLLETIGRYADRLTWAYAHVCGSLLMAEKLGSSNVNLFTNTNRNFTEDREAKFMDEAIILAKPIARDMLKELSRVSAVIDRTERPFEGGYSSGSFV